MSFEISFGLVCLGQFEYVSDQHRVVQNTKTYTWDGMDGWMDGRLSLFDGLLRAPMVLKSVTSLLDDIPSGSWSQVDVKM